jgi:predicted DNA-binding protein with PD1-like motif
MRQITRRLKPGQLLKESIIQLVEEEDIKAGVILAAVGGLENANLRVSKFESGEHPMLTIDGPLELVSCTGTLSSEGCHLHVSVSDRSGQCHGGHLKNGCRVFVTIELVVLVFDDVIYNRTLDSETGFDELSPVPPAGKLL